MNPVFLTTVVTTSTGGGFPLNTMLLMFFLIAIRWVPLIILFVLAVKALLKYLNQL